MPVFIHQTVQNYNPPDTSKIKHFLETVIEHENCQTGNINIIYTDNSEILQLNKNYLNHHYYTDVITFHYNENNILHGDIYISLDKVAENAKEYNVSFYNETLRVIIHGILHLAGYKDSTDEEKLSMRAKENYYLELFNLE